MNDGIEMMNHPEKLMKAMDVAEILNISRAFAYRLMQQGQIRTIKIGNARRVHPADLRLFIENNVSSTPGRTFGEY